MLRPARMAAAGLASHVYRSGVEPGTLVLIILKALVVALAFYPLVRPGSAHFEGKALRFRAVLYPAMMLLIPGVWWSAGQPSPYPILADVCLAIPFAVDAAANVLGLFRIKGFDAIPHSTDGSS